MRARRWGPRGAVALTVLGLTGEPLALPATTDARAVARAGIWASDGLESSPGAARPQGARLRLDRVDLYYGTGIVVGAASAEAVGTRAGLAVACIGLWSPVGETLALRAAGQLRSGCWRAGLGLDVRGVALGPYARAWEVVPRVGCGWSLEKRIAVAAVAEQALVPQSAPRATLAAEIRIAPAIDFGIQADRQPGVPVTLRVGIACSAAPLSMSAGFESSAQTCSLGFSWTWGTQEIAWAGATHPALGWSHAWTYAVSLR